MDLVLDGRVGGFLNGVSHDGSLGFTGGVIRGLPSIGEPVVEACSIVELAG